MSKLKHEDFPLETPPAPEEPPVPEVPLAVGDRVVLDVEHCPLLTVADVTAHDVRCRWFDAGGFHEQTFHKSELKRPASKAR